jgi:cysteinyl-tRNA synthetase
MKIYNSATKTKEEFVPQDKDNVKMYACGITPYDDCHIGHARQAIVYDMMSRYLRYRGYTVTYVRNYTDVDDKIIARANQLGVDALAYSQQKIREAEEDLKNLGIEDADKKPKVSEYIDIIVDFIKKLIKKGHAYPSKKGDVWFSIKSFPGYGKLSKKDPEELLAGVRKDLEEGKRDPRDFALWKAAKEGEIFWKSPWGKGRPGWHIECSAMALNTLGETLDIHGGGKDLIFPHHENEVAQSEALTGKPLARIWTHNGLVTIAGQKMSKSLGNTLTIKEALGKCLPEVIRHAVLSRHYTADVDINDREFSLSEKHLYYFYTTLSDIDAFLAENKPTAEEIRVSNNVGKTVTSAFIEAMDDDFNTSLAISGMFQVCKFANTLIADKKQPKGAVAAALRAIREDVVSVYAVLGLMQENPAVFIKSLKQKHLLETDMTEEKIDALIKERADAKEKRNYAVADEIRQNLDMLGITLQDSRTGTTWGLKLGALPL